MAQKTKLATGIVEILPPTRVFVILGLPDFQYHNYLPGCQGDQHEAGFSEKLCDIILNS